MFPWKNITLTDMTEVETIINEMLSIGVEICFRLPSGEYYGDVTKAEAVDDGGIQISMMFQGLEMTVLIPNSTPIFIANNHDSAIVSREKDR